MRVISLLPAVCLAAAAQGQSQHMNVTISGNPGGESSWTPLPDGSFKGSSTLHLGGLTLNAAIAGKLTAGKIESLHAENVSPAGSTILDVKDEVSTLTAGKTTKTTPFKQTTTFYAANLIPGAWTTTALELRRQLIAHPTQGMMSVSTYFLDVGQAVSITAKLLPDRIITTKTGAETIERLECSAGLTQLELDFKPDGTILAFDVPGQKIRFVADGYEGLFEDPLAKYPELSQPTYKTVTQTKVPVRLSDGTVLATDIERPDAEGKFPVVLVRTPYGRAMSMMDGDFYAKRGYVYISQDCRGRGDSTGEWDPFIHEGKDGYETIDWIAKQTWSNGRVGMIGGSYLGYVQWAVAVLHPAALKCIVPQVSPPDAMHNLPYEFGCPFIYGDIWWAKIVAGKDADFSSFMAPLPHPDKMTVLPLNKLDKAVLGQSIPFYQKWITRTTSRDWKGWDFNSNLKDADVPALHISGLWDGDGIGTKLNWAAERSLGRKDQWLIEGPWTHAFNSSTSIGKLDFGPSAILELDSLYLRWFDTWLKEKPVGLDKVAHVKIFVTGLNQWKELSDWPDPSEKLRTFYLSQDALVEKPPHTSSEEYTFDPAKNVSTAVVAKGNQAIGDFTGKFEGLDKTKGKYLLFQSRPFTADTILAGPATVDLTFKTSAYDTDFFVNFVDVDEKGAYNVVGTGGKLRASYRNGVDRIDYLTPGKVYKVTVLPWDFAKQFKKGHRLAMVVTSSAFPLFARNFGTKEPIATGTHMIVQKNTLLFGGASPSKVTVHVMP